MDKNIFNLKKVLCLEINSVANHQLDPCLGFVPKIKEVQGSKETTEKSPTDNKGDRLKSPEVNVVKRPGYDRTFNHRIQIHRLACL